MKLDVKGKPSNGKVYGLVDELPDRIDAITWFFPQFVAEMALADLKRSAPADLPGYPKNVVLRRYGDPGSDSTVGMIVPGYAHSRKLKANDAQRMILYVKAKKLAAGAVPSDESSAFFRAAEVLEAFSPWTMATLPIELSRTFAGIRSRRVTRKEVLSVEKRRKADMARTGAALAQLAQTGIELKRAHPVLLTRRVTQDLAFEVLRREFGINAPHVAHWRPAIRNAKRTYPRQVLKRWMLRWFAVSTEKRWRSRGKPLKLDRTSTLRGLQEFQGHIARTALRG